ncbi:MAG: hypothetical protein ACLR44_01725 [Clostridia bacterium]
MENKEDWEELQKWQEKQEEVKKQNNIKEFVPKEYKKTELLTKIIRKMLNSISTIFVIIFIIGFIGAMIFIKNSFGNFASINVKKHLKEVYRGQKFVVVEDYGKNINMDNGEYLMSPNNNKNIVFKIYRKSTNVYNDYSENRLKYYIENCEDKSLVDCLCIEQGTRFEYGVEFLKYDVFIDVNSYDQIEEACTKAYKIVEYLMKKDKRMYETVTVRNKSINYYHSFRCNELGSLEYEIDNAKKQYKKME